jgi:hypothetical protein
MIDYIMSLVITNILELKKFIHQFVYLYNLLLSLFLFALHKNNNYFSFHIQNYRCHNFQIHKLPGSKPLLYLLHIYCTM